MTSPVGPVDERRAVGVALDVLEDVLGERNVRDVEVGVRDSG